MSPSFAASAIAIEGLSHWYGRGSTRRQVLQRVDLQVAPGEVVLLTGPSGCGKTTLLTLVGALRQVQQGSVAVLGQQLNGAGRGSRQRLRRSIGMIFQGHNLLRCLSAEQNVQMGADLLSGLGYRARRDQARSGCARSVSAMSCTSCPTTSPVARSSASRSPALLLPGPGCSWLTNPPLPSIRAPAARWWSCCSARRASRSVRC